MPTTDELLVISEIYTILTCRSHLTACCSQVSEWKCCMHPRAPTCCQRDRACWSIDGLELRLTVVVLKEEKVKMGTADALYCTKVKISKSEERLLQ